MPAYNQSPFSRQAIPLETGLPVYLFGSYSQDKSNTKIRVVSVSGPTTGTLQADGFIIDGDVPVVGALASARISTPSFPAMENADNAAITVVSNYVPATGGVSVAFPLADVSGAFSTTASTGIVLIPQPEIGEAVANGASIAATTPQDTAQNSAARTYYAAVKFPKIPTAASVTLQGAIVDEDSEFRDIGVVATVTASVVSTNQAQFISSLYRFLRFDVSGVTGTGTIVARILA